MIGSSSLVKLGARRAVSSRLMGGGGRGPYVGNSRKGGAVETGGAEGNTGREGGWEGVG